MNESFDFWGKTTSFEWEMNENMGGYSQMSPSVYVQSITANICSLFNNMSQAHLDT